MDTNCYIKNIYGKHSIHTFSAPEYHLSLIKSSINMFLKTITKAIEKPTNKLIE